MAGGVAARDLTAELRRAGLRADRAFDGRSMKSQMKQADRSGARLASSSARTSRRRVRCRSGPCGATASSGACRRAMSTPWPRRPAAARRRPVTSEPADHRSAPASEGTQCDRSVRARPSRRPPRCGPTCCGEVRAEDVGPRSLCGWVARRREHGEHLAFVDLRDHTGVVQCVVDGAVDVRSEYVVAVEGTVRRRPEGTVNPRWPPARSRSAIAGRGAGRRPSRRRSRSTTGPTSTRSVRLRYRFVDLRRPRMQANLRLRARVSRPSASHGRAGLRRGRDPAALGAHARGRPGVRRAQPAPSGSFYVLPQSPQLAKQLLDGRRLDRYYQIARCLRDEDLRADRQFEFTQLDMEASFVGQEGRPGVRHRRRRSTPPRQSPASGPRRSSG